MSVSSPTPSRRHTAPALPRTARGSGVELRKLGRSFGPSRVLQSVNLSIAAGEFVAIVGRSGGGKTTLLRLISGLDAPTEGSIWIDGKPSTGLNPTVRMLFQEARLLPWLTVEQNVGLGLGAPDHRLITEMIAKVGLAGRERDWPRLLSGGQRQRVALARALVTDPSILLLDEPLCSLDALTRIEMHGLIESLWRERGFTGLLITHDVDEAIALADRVLVLEQGRFVMEMPVELPHPRQRENPDFSQLARRVLQRLLDTPLAATFAEEA